MTSPQTIDIDAELAPPPWLAQELRTAVHELASFERPSASGGERRAAEWIAARMRELRHPATVEVERAHGGYWWPLGLLNGAAAAAGLAALRFPALHERSKQSFPIMYATWLGPVLVALGSILGRVRLQRAGSLLAVGAAVAMADIGRSEVVPGANDNLSAVAVLVALARSLAERPTPGVRVLLLSTGSEESFMEGMQGFVRRHRAELDPARTTVLCLECLGSPTLTLVEAEGMLRMRPYSDIARRRLADAGEAAGVELVRGLRTVAATDALVAMRRGYPAVTLASIDETKFPSNYHWPTDTPENLDWGTIQRAFTVADRFLRAR